MRFWSLAWALPLCLLSCGDKSAVSLTVTLDQPMVAVQDGALGATLAGGFTLKFELGPEASGSTTVSLGSFALQTAAGSALVDPVKLDSTDATFPLVIDKGSAQTVTFTLSSTKVLSASDHDALCAGQVKIVGTVMDSLKGGTDSLSSNAIAPSCT